MTKGFKSTEFWFALAALAAAVFLGYQGAAAEIVLGIAGLSVGYSVSRGIAKRNGAG